jgi:hypothetical protein
MRAAAHNPMHNPVQNPVHNPLRPTLSLANMRGFRGGRATSLQNIMKPFTMLAALVFLVVAAVHAYRVYAGWAVVIGPYSIPAWVSYGGVVVPLLLAILLLREARS